jgi:hypothetical protein
LAALWAEVFAFAEVVAAGGALAAAEAEFAAAVAAEDEGGRDGEGEEEGPEGEEEDVQIRENRRPGMVMLFKCAKSKNLWMGILIIQIRIRVEGLTVVMKPSFRPGSYYVIFLKYVVVGEE